MTDVKSSWAGNTQYHVLVVGSQNIAKSKFIIQALNIAPEAALGDTARMLKSTITLAKAKVTVELSTTSGCEELWGLKDELYRKAHAVLCLYSEQESSSFERILRLQEEALRIKDVHALPFGIVSITEKATAQVASDAAKARAEKLGKCPYWEVSMTNAPSVKPRRGTISTHVVVNPSQCLQEFMRSVYEFYSSQTSKGDADEEGDKYTILVAGDTYVGKTTFIRQFVSKKFTSKYTETRGSIAAPQFRFKHDNESYLLTFVDSHGAATEFGRDVLAGVDGIVLLYSATSILSFNRCQDLYQAIAKGKGTFSVPCCLIGTKTDLDNRTVAKSMGDKYAKSIGASHFCTSLVEDAGLEEMVGKLISNIKTHVDKDNSLVIVNLDRSGPMSKESKPGKKGKPIVAIIKQGVLHATSDGTITSKTLAINLDPSVSIETLPADPAHKYFPFQLDTGAKCYYFSVPSESSLMEWIQCIVTNIAYHDIAECLIDEVMQTIILEDSGKDLKRSGKAIPQSPDRRSIIVANTASEKKGKRMSMAFKKRTGSLKKDKVLKLKEDKKKKK